MVLIGLGSNQGDSAAIVTQALEALRGLAADELRASSLWRTTPVDCPPGSPDFINAVAGFDPPLELRPEELATELKRIERGFGRRYATQRNAPRVLDLDLLMFAGERRNGPELTLPHPRAAQRRFVLAPAAEVAPGLVWPGTGVTVAELLERLESAEVVTVVSGPT